MKPFRDNLKGTRKREPWNEKRDAEEEPWEERNVEEKMRGKGYRRERETKERKRECERPREGKSDMQDQKRE